MIADWDELAAGRVPIDGIKDGNLTVVRKRRVDWASRLGMAINVYEASIGSGPESFRAEDLRAMLAGAGLDGVVCGGIVYRVGHTEHGVPTLTRGKADRRPIPAPKVARLADLPNGVGQKLAGLIDVFESARRAFGADSGDAADRALNAAFALLHEIRDAGLAGVIVDHDGDLIEFRATGRADGNARSLERVVLRDQADATDVGEAERFHWDGDTGEDGEPERNLFLDGKLVGYVYEPEPERASWRWVYGDGPDWSDFSHIPESELVRSWRDYRTEELARAALEAYAWAKS